MAQVGSTSRVHASSAQRWVLICIIAVCVVGAGLTYKRWLPMLHGQLARFTGSQEEEAPEKKEDAHGDEGHAGHDHAGHDESNSIELSAQARRNIGLVMREVALGSFTRTISVPGIVVERPGRSTIQVTTPMTGIVTRIYVGEGESIEPGQQLFDLRLTHEEIVQAQADLLRTAEELDVVAREIKRLETVTAGGALPGKALLERQYEQQKLEAVNRSQQQALLLHGLSKNQVEDILKNRSLLQNVVISAPTATMDKLSSGSDKLFQAQTLKVAPGQHVNAGDSLATLIDYEILFIQGGAFEHDAKAIRRAAQKGWKATALSDTDGNDVERIEGLDFLYLSSKVDSETRTLDFYVTLPNKLETNSNASGESKFLDWQYRPGQRMQLLIPVETWTDRIVVPVGAIAQDGVETYVFSANGDHFDRRPVHVEYRDDQSAVIANDGAVFPGDIIAMNGAQQLQLALKNKAGGGVDPHAGHNH